MLDNVCLARRLNNWPSVVEELQNRRWRLRFDLSRGREGNVLDCGFLALTESQPIVLLLAGDAATNAVDEAHSIVYITC